MSPTQPLRDAADEFGVRASAASLEWLARYLAAMLDENRRVNLTAVRELAAATAFHAVDALALGLWCHEASETAYGDDMPAAPTRVLDLGTGNGFPGVAAIALWPHCEVVLCDRTRKKVDAIGRALEAAGEPPGGSARVTTLWADAAQLPGRQPDMRGAFDCVLARAVAEPQPVARLGEPLLAKGGSLLLWLTPETAAPERLGRRLTRQGLREYRLPPPADRARCLGIWG